MQPFDLPSDLPNDFFNWPEYKQEQWIIEQSRNTQPPEENRRPPQMQGCLLYTSPSPRDLSTSRMPSSA